MDALLRKSQTFIYPTQETQEACQHLHALIPEAFVRLRALYPRDVFVVEVRCATGEEAEWAARALTERL